MAIDSPVPEVLKIKASDRTGLEDFGDPACDIPFETYIAAVAEETWPGMTDPAREKAIEYFVHLLSLRLRLVADRKQYPAIAKQRIRAPIIIIGPPRSGSTLLHTLISQDPDNQAVEHWVCLEPSPPLALGAPDEERLELAHNRLMGLFELIPDIFVTHPYLIEEGASALAECGSDIMNIMFTSQQLWCFYRSEGYRRYLLEADHRQAVRFHHDFLQHLQWGTEGKRWSLKGSDHLLWLESLAAQYPDAMLVWTHRDLSQQLGSLASVQSILKGITGHPPTKEERKALGREAIDLQCATFLKGIQARDKVGEAPFFDVSYHDVMAKPVETVARIYKRFGLSMSARHIDNIRSWLADNPQAKHGVHRHSAEEFGIDAESVNRQFAPYIERFGFGFGIRPPLTD